MNHSTQTRQKGFSLVELLIVMGLMAMLLTVLTDVFVTVLSARTESQSSSAVSQDGRYLLSRLAYDIGQASSVTAPENLQVSVSGITGTTATIAWTTVVASDTRVEYGTTTAYGQVATNASMVTAHSIGLSGLTTNTTYNFRVVSRDAGNNTTTSTNYTFITTASATITHIQSAATNSDSGSTTIARSFTSNTTTGDAIVAGVSWDGNVAISCSDNLGNSYSVAVSTFDTTNNQSVGVCYATNITGGATTVTVNFGVSTGFRHLVIGQYRGVATASALDVTSSNIAPGTTTPNGVTSGSATTTSNGDLIYGAVMDTGSVSTITAGTSFTQRSSNGQFAVQDRVQASAGSVASTQTFSNANRYAAVMVTLKSASAPTPASLGATGPRLVLVIDGVTHTYALSGDTLQLTNNQGTNALHSSETQISNISFQRLGNPTGRETIRLTFTVSSRASPTHSQTFTTTVGRRL